MNPDEPYLDYYDVDGETRWNWKFSDERLVSQEFDSEEDALEAWRNDKLVWEARPQSLWD
jgi:hypothetical protein